MTCLESLACVILELNPGQSGSCVLKPIKRNSPFARSIHQSPAEYLPCARSPAECCHVCIDATQALHSVKRWPDKVTSVWAWGAEPGSTAHAHFLSSRQEKSRLQFLECNQRLPKRNGEGAGLGPFLKE